MDISSLIDVSFLLLIYFLVTSTLVRKEQDLSIDLPTDPRMSPSKVRPMLIRVEEGGQVFLGEPGPTEELVGEDDGQRSLPRLEQRLNLFRTALEGAGAQPVVQIYFADEVRQQRVIDVLNALVACRIHSVTFTDLVDF